MLLISFNISFNALSQDKKEFSVEEAVSDISPSPMEVSFSNSLEIVNSGGHIQGIQKLRHNNTDYYVLSGSSSEYSYYAIVKTGKVNLVTSVNKILDKPLKHAGGFQIWENLMAIGVEDNEAKNKSRVFVFNLDNPEKPPEKPLTIIERIGTFKRATAGCVAITIIDQKVLIAVGDWDSKHLDFYRVSEEKLYEEGAVLELEYSIDSQKLKKDNWVDESWNSYQAINFLKDADENLFLAGMTSSEQGEEIIDLFFIESHDLSEFALKKIYSRKFPAHPKTKFRWGAGLSSDIDGKIRLMASEEHINPTSLFTIYE